ncbi:MAG: U32 family peptidase [Alphaproteobacteria bacterium]|nr:U32 family peptidase [Alphaproteobacteria bacterium]
MTSGTALTLGPVMFNWPVERWRDFHFAIADEAPVDTVCVGEIVCAKRAPFLAPALPAVVERLVRAGKEVVLASPILVGSAREVADARALAATPDFLVEANDMGMVGLLAGRPHCIGPTVNVYNERSLALLARRGAVRCTLPWELPRASIARLARAETGAQLEVAVFGRMPLAISARCYHARAHGLAKDSCRYVCANDADGMEVQTLDGEPFLAVNGTQTLSFRYLNLVGELAALRAIGVGRFRLSPHALDMVAVARIFRDVLDGALEAGQAQERLRTVAPAAVFADGFFRGRPGADWGAGGADPPGE